MYYFYVLFSLKDGKLYKGSTSNLIRRISDHNDGKTKSTKHRRPFILLYFERYDQKAEALKRERFSKSLEGGPEVKALLNEKKLLTKDGKLWVKSSTG